MTSGARMPHQGAPMGPPGPPYGGTPPIRPGMPNPALDPNRKRPAPTQPVQPPPVQNRPRNAKRRKMADKILPQRIRELVPESQAYMDLLAFERKLDQTIMRKRVDIQEALKRPMKQKRKLRLYISNTFNPAKPDAEDSEGSIASWELRVEGKLLDDPGKQKRKFSSFFKSLVIELDKDLYGPDNHLVEWHRTPTTQETDGFQVKRPGDVNVRCTLLLMLDYQSQMNGFLLSTANQQEIASLDNKIHETIESINQLKIQRDFMLSFSRDPKGYIQDWICSQNRDLKIQQRRQELEQALAMRTT
ncbi:SWI/SNF-related matrix-associated actin-dependent regulator of chromatin subfamily D member 3 [Labeo rohita]|uniref:SWI/SNF-related matrix-associated actin-dependent regulator of chromatin subfamily D member 3 n=1 Tax=Labeo rohita TaxID=84645 RepID=A0ABQ8MYJ6_LABRO|nr:SWI/SNF-related matrix-associated actin-dependent regulator of chromatin subfamily D member 3 [Labeo rohita]